MAEAVATPPPAANTPPPTSPEPTEAPAADASPPDGGTAPAPEKKDPMSPRFAALAKREKAIVESQNAVKAREAELEAKLQDITKREAAIAVMAKAKAAIEAGDWDAVAAELGVAQDDERLNAFMKGMTSVALRKKELPPEVIETMRAVRQMQAEKEAAAQLQKKADEEAAKKAEEKKKTDADEYRANFKRTFLEGPTSTFIKEHAADLEIVSYNVGQGEGTRAAVLEKIWAKLEQNYKTTPTKTADDEAKLLAKSVQDVEDELTKDFAGEIQKLLGLKKLQPKTETPPAPKSGREFRKEALKQIDGQPATPRPKTLTNSVQQAPVRDEAESTDPDVLFERALKLM